MLHDLIKQSIILHVVAESKAGPERQPQWGYMAGSCRHLAVVCFFCALLPETSEVFISSTFCAYMWLQVLVAEIIS